MAILPGAVLHAMGTHPVPAPGRPLLRSTEKIKFGSHALPALLLALSLGACHKDPPPPPEVPPPGPAAAMDSGEPEPATGSGELEPASDSADAATPPADDPRAVARQAREAMRRGVEEGRRQREALQDH